MIVYVLHANNSSDFKEADVVTVGITEAITYQAFRNELYERWVKFDEDDKDFYDNDFEKYVDVWRTDTNSYVVKEA
jgi:hypothetical protein